MVRTRNIDSTKYTESKTYTAITKHAIKEIPELGNTIEYPYVLFCYMMLDVSFQVSNLCYMEKIGLASNVNVKYTWNGFNGCFTIQ